MTPLLALVAFQAAIVDPTKEAALAKPISIKLAMTPLRDVTKEMTKAAGVPIDVAGVLADWKATVLVKDLPASRTMEALADTLGLVWRLDGGVYRLSRPDGAAAAETSYLAEERKKAEESPNVGLITEQVGSPATANVRRAVRNSRRRMIPPTSNDGSGKTYSRFDPNLLAVETSNGQPPSRLEPTNVSGTSAFAKAVAAWPSVPEKVDEAWSRAVPMGNPGSSTWEGGEFALSDLLLAFHNASGLPVVADAFRVPVQERVMPQGSGLSSLQQLAANDQLFLKLSDGVARLRHPAFWRLREQEISEAAWKNVERKNVTLEAVAQFAGRLSAAQAATFRSQEPPLSHNSTSALRDAYPALLLWNVLTPAARNAAYKGQPVPISAVPGALNAFNYALREAPYFKAGDPAPILELPPNRLGLFGTPTDKSIDLRLGNPEGQGVSYLMTYP